MKWVIYTICEKLPYDTIYKMIWKQKISIFLGEDYAYYHMDVWSLICAES